MQRLVCLLSCVATVGVLALAVTGPALASGSAAGQQYTDPLAGSTTPSSGSSQGSGSGSSQGSGSSSSSQGSGSSSSSSSSSGSGSGSSLSSSGPSSSSTGSGTTSSSGSTASGHNLPFTGLNIWACLSVGFALMGSGLLLRYALRRAW